MIRDVERTEHKLVSNPGHENKKLEWNNKENSILVWRAFSNINRLICATTHVNTVKVCTENHHLYDTQCSTGIHWARIVIQSDTRSALQYMFWICAKTERKNISLKSRSLQTRKPGGSLDQRNNANLTCLITQSSATLFLDLNKTHAAIFIH